VSGRHHSESAADRDADIDRQIIESYTQRHKEDLVGFEAAGRAMIEAEPWEPSAR
jgi:hypothetical protein